MTEPKPTFSTFPVRSRAGALVVATGLLAGCSDSLPSLPKLTDLNPFAEKQVPLPGKRVSVMQESSKIGGELATADKPISLPALSSNEAWSQPGGNAANAPGHLALAASVKTAWSADVGTGSSKYGKIAASPIVYGGRVYTLDAAGLVTAIATAGGGAVWRASVVPDGEKNAQKGYGGGLAADNARLYAATGFGTMVALDPQSGKKLWEKSAGVPFRSSPTAVGDRVFAVTTDGQLYCFNGADGAELWTFRGLPEKASIISNASPAVDGDLVVVPFTSGDLVALKISTGQPVWNESLARTRTASSLAALSDAGRPAIDGGIVFAVGHAGRMIATSARTGERLWSLSVPSIQQPWVAGESVFVVDTAGHLMAVTKRDGKVQWTVKLPGAGTWSGPVLAGNHLWAVSSQGVLAHVEATTGRVAGSQDLGAPVYVSPIVASGRMFVLTDKARLIALN
jgi:outer membrane protein assembly factor BamB